MKIPIDVVIRAHDCNQNLLLVLDSLAKQEQVALTIYLVDNSPTSIPQEVLPAGGVIIPYTLPRFSYAMSINIAIPYLNSDFVLICSSHTLLENHQALQYSASLLRNNADYGAACFSSTELGDLDFTCTEGSNFSGWNGTWNTSSLYRTSLLRERPFNPDVFSAEDQEWSRWVVEKKGLKIAHVKGSGVNNMNPVKDSTTKRIQEWMGVALYAFPDYHMPRFIASRLWLSIKYLLKGKVRESIFWARVFWALLQSKFFSPKGI